MKHKINIRCFHLDEKQAAVCSYVHKYAADERSFLFFCWLRGARVSDHELAAAAAFNVTCKKRKRKNNLIITKRGHKHYYNKYVKM